LVIAFDERGRHRASFCALPPSSKGRRMKQAPMISATVFLPALAVGV
jgi:hypothetical protein